MYHSPTICKVESSLIRIFVKVYLGLGKFHHPSLPSPHPSPDQSDTVHIEPQPGALLQLQTTFHRECHKLECLDTERDVWNPAQVGSYHGMMEGYSLIIKDSFQRP